jgi:hypothetical protein
LAAVHAEGNATADACEDEKAETPNPSHSSRHLSGEIVSLPPADGAHQSSSGDKALSSLVGDESLSTLIVGVVVVGRGGRRSVVVVYLKPEVLGTYP